MLSTVCINIYIYIYIIVVMICNRLLNSHTFDGRLTHLVLLSHSHLWISYTAQFCFNFFKKHLISNAATVVHIITELYIEKAKYFSKISHQYLYMMEFLQILFKSALKNAGNGIFRHLSIQDIFGSADLAGAVTNLTSCWLSQVVKLQIICLPNWRGKDLIALLYLPGKKNQYIYNKHSVLR